MTQTHGLDQLLVALTLGDPTTVGLTKFEPDADFCTTVTLNGWAIYKGSIGSATWWYIVKNVEEFEAYWHSQMPDQPLPVRL